MAAKKKTDFSKMSQEDLSNRLVEVSDELKTARLKFRIGQFKKTSEFPRMRKEIAKIKTTLRQLASETKG